MSNIEDFSQVIDAVEELEANVCTAALAGIDISEAVEPAYLALELVLGEDLMEVLSEEIRVRIEEKEDFDDSDEDEDEFEEDEDEYAYEGDFVLTLRSPDAADDATPENSEDGNFVNVYDWEEAFEQIMDFNYTVYM